MTYDELRSSLTSLVTRYVPSAEQRTALLQLIAEPEIPVKGILADMSPMHLASMTEQDAALLRDIVHHYG
ncbi:hypothetical protein [Chitinimonas sp.]|uniref:hypothetical protein n=1 Tax=Chitinimonas sp. TaxID=1934313 RepID=UPI002F94FAE1